MDCECTMTQIAGDGCEICNPEKALEIERENNAKLVEQNKELVGALESLHIDIKESYKWGKLAEIHHYDNLMIKMDKTIQQSLPPAKGKENVPNPVGQLNKIKEFKPLTMDELAELEDEATCPHGFLVGCPTCTTSAEGKEE